MILTSITSFTLWMFDFLQPAATGSGGGGGGASGGGGGAGPFGCADAGGPQTIGFVLVFMAIMYFMIMRPEQQRRTETDKMLKQLKRGDKVRTTGGILGEIVTVRENDMDIAIADRVKINVLRAHVAGLEREPQKESDKKDSDKKEAKDTKDDAKA